LFLPNDPIGKVCDDQDKVDEDNNGSFWRHGTLNNNNNCSGVVVVASPQLSNGVVLSGRSAINIICTVVVCFIRRSGQV
jgi:hypothetical protein